MKNYNINLAILLGNGTIEWSEEEGALIVTLDQPTGLRGKLIHKLIERAMKKLEIVDFSAYLSMKGDKRRQISFNYTN